MSSNLIKRIVVSLIFAGLGLLLLVVLPPKPAIFVQPMFFSETGPLTPQTEVVQTFKGSGVITGVGIAFTAAKADIDTWIKNPSGHVECKVVEIMEGYSPSSWRLKTLSRDFTSLSSVPSRRRWVFDVGKIRIQSDKRYAVVISTDEPKKQVALLMDVKPLSKKQPLYQGGTKLNGTLSFRLYGEPSLRVLYDAFMNATPKSLVRPGVIAALIAGYLVVGSMLIAEVWLGRHARLRPPR